MGNVICQEGSFKDERDGRVYKTVKIENQVWMAENLKYKPEDGNYTVYNDSIELFETHGYLYDWETANNVCPSGWHLPSYNSVIFLGFGDSLSDFKKDWNILHENLAKKSLKKTDYSDPNSIDNQSYNKSLKLEFIKSKTGWDDNLNGNNKSGFNVMPSGGYSTSLSSFYGLGYSSTFWSSSSWFTDSTALDTTLSYLGRPPSYISKYAEFNKDNNNLTDADVYVIGKSYFATGLTNIKDKLSVRCIKD